MPSSRWIREPSRRWAPPLETRVMGLCIRDCAEKCDSYVPRCTKVSAIDVTAWTIFERLCLVPGLGKFGPWINCPCAPTPPPLTRQLFLDFRVILRIQKFYRVREHCHQYVILPPSPYFLPLFSDLDGKPRSQLTATCSPSRLRVAAPFLTGQLLSSLNSAITWGYLTCKKAVDSTASCLPSQ